MKTDILEMTFGIQSELVTSTAVNFRPPSWPPPRDWPVVIDKDGSVLAYWGDSMWQLTPWADRPVILDFGDGAVAKRKGVKSIDPVNADILRIISTWLIWGPLAARSVSTAYRKFRIVRAIVSLCSNNGISAATLMRFPKVFDKVKESVSPSDYDFIVSLFHSLYDARETLGFTIIDADGLRRLANTSPNHRPVQTPYIPPRIWLYQITRLRECLTDFLKHEEQIKACFQFCLDSYIKKNGTLEAALSPKKTPTTRSPFVSGLSYQPDFAGTFFEVATRFGIAELLAKWVNSPQNKAELDSLSIYFSIVTIAGLAYICNFTLQRKEEVASLRANCLTWDEDETYGRVPIICGETSKTDPDSDARWIASPSVEVAIQALSTIALMRMTCDQANPVARPNPSDQANPYLYSSPTEPWSTGSGKSRAYEIRSPIRSIVEMMDQYVNLFDVEKLKITAEDLEIARRLTPNLPEKEFAVGKVWPLAWHQYRRTGAVNMFASGDISDSTMQHQMKHSSRLMPLYYGRNHSRLNLNQEVQATVVMAMYQAQVEIAKVVITTDRFISPQAPERKEALADNILSVKDVKDLIAMAKKGTIAFRENRLGGCMKAGNCEYGGIESVARCAGGDGHKPCNDVLFDRKKEPQVRADLRRVLEEIALLSAGQPRYKALIEEQRAMENYLDAISRH